MPIDPKHFEGPFIPRGTAGIVVTEEGQTYRGIYMFAWIGIEEMFDVACEDGERRTFWYTNGDRFYPEGVGILRETTAGPAYRAAHARDPDSRAGNGHGGHHAEGRVRSPQDHP